MKTNDLKKGDSVRLHNGWNATIEDNLKGNTRMATVEGFVTEMGSIYSHDIKVFLSKDTFEIDIELTPKQIKFRDTLESYSRLYR
jgi:hypothetical protein